jgi:hypothetical protein
MTKTLLIIVTEGPTDDEFYRRLLPEIKRQNGGSPFGFSKIDFVCATGISRFENKIVARIQQQFCTGDYATYEKTVCLCYDQDVFDRFAMHPPVDWNSVRTRIHAMGISSIIEIKADQMIEDFFLCDIEGIKRFLRISKDYSLPHGLRSLMALETLYRKGNRVYVKGEKAEGLIASLNFTIIMAKICSSIAPLCDVLGYHCARDKCPIQSME